MTDRGQLSSAQDILYLLRWIRKRSQKDDDTARELRKILAVLGLRKTDKEE